MSTAVMVAPGSGRLGWFERNAFVLRRLHSLTGVFPIGLFLCFHLSANASVILGDHVYQFVVDKIHSLGPFVPVASWVMIMLPILFHAGLGIVYTMSAGVNTGMYPYGGNIRYLIQRITGIILLFFIAFHVLTLKFGVEILKYTPFVAYGGEPDGISNIATETTSFALQYQWWVLPVYLVGVLSAVFHFANGVWTFLITWGITIGEKAQRNAAIVCLALGLALGAAGVSSAITFTYGRTVNPKVNSDTIGTLRSGYDQHKDPSKPWLTPTSQPSDAAAATPGH